MSTIGAFAQQSQATKVWRVHMACAGGVVQPRRRLNVTMPHNNQAVREQSVLRYGRLPALLRVGERGNSA